MAANAVNESLFFLETKIMIPLISVALCTYNGATYLEEQLDSVLAQDWPNLEIIVVDDASTDQTQEILLRYEAKDSRIRLYFNEENLGFLANFQKAISLTQGDFIAPCDQDDWWNPTKLTALQKAIDNNGIIYCNSLMVDAEGNSLNLHVSDLVNMYSGCDPTTFTFGNCASGHAQLIRRSVVIRAMPFPKECFHDWWLAFVAASSEGLAYLPEELVHYRQHAKTQTDLAKRKGRERRSRFRAEEFKSRQRWLEALASIPGAYQGFFIDLCVAHADWLSSWISPRLVSLLIRRRRSLFRISRRDSKAPLRKALSFFWGLRAKQFFLPKRYGKFSI